MMPPPYEGIRTGSRYRSRELADYLLPMLVGGGVVLSMLVMVVVGMGLVWLAVTIGMDIGRRLVGG